MTNVLIIGYGNRLRSDDGLGPRAGEELSASLLAAEAEILVTHQLTPELAERISHVEAVLFIDAAHTGPRGEIRCRELQPYGTLSLFAHQLTPEALMSLCCQLYGACPRGIEISFRGECFEVGEKLSAEVELALPHLIEFTKDFCQRLLRNTDRGQAMSLASW